MPATPIDFERHLNPDQLAAVTHGDGPQLVIAGAGSGKTRVITYRIAWLIQERGVDPRTITAVTFTNKAAAEMRERVEQLLGVYPLATFVGTFHRFALVLLRRYGEGVGLDRDFVILDGDDQKRLVKRALEIEGLDPASFQPQTVLAAISGAKNRLLDPAAYERQATDFFRRHVARVYRRYQQLAFQAGGIDFDDMIRLAVRLLDRDAELKARVGRFNRHLLVDEFQDTNHAQMRLIHALAGDGGNLTAVGDEDQGIYRWRGAELDNILRFEASFPGAVVRKLERNYRSTQTILDAAGALVEHNEGRRGKRLWTDAGDGEPILLYRASDELDEAAWVARTLTALAPEYGGWPGTAVLVRTNAQTRALEDALLRHDVPYCLVGGVRFYERAEVKDLIAYLRLLRNPRDELSFNRVLNRPARGIGRRTHEELLRRAGELELAPWDLLAEERLDGLTPRARRALLAFHDLIAGLRDDAETLPLPQLLKRLLEVTGYAGLHDKPDAESQARLENVGEFLSAAEEFLEQAGGDQTAGEQLTAFLDHVSLTADVDGLDRQRGVSLMTLHSAKGLEFPLVVVAGLEDGLLPHWNAQNQPEDVEEERRLLYVGMTRAERRLILTCCRRRRVAGRYQEQRESPFLSEIPIRYLRVEESPQLFAPHSWRDGGNPRRTAEDVYRFFQRETAAAGAEAAVAAAASVRTSAPQDAAQETGERLRKGSRVRHDKLGKGVVLSFEGSGPDLRLVVYFEGYGRRKLVARYARLDVL